MGVLPFKYYKVHKSLEMYQYYLPLKVSKTYFKKMTGLIKPKGTLDLVGLIDAKGIDVAQPIWLRDCLTQ